MPNSITNRQMFFILFLTLTAFTTIDISKVMAQCAGTGSWVTILIASVLFALAAFLLVSLNNMFQGKVLFEYSHELVGRIGAYFIAIYYIQYFLTVLVTLVLSMSSLLKVHFLHNTPVWATTLAALPVFGFVAYKGVTNVARLFEIYGAIFISVVIVVHITMLIQGNSGYVLPLFIPSETGRYIKAIKEVVFPFLGIEVLTIIPFTAKNGKRAAAQALITIMFIGLFYILVVESSIMMVGLNEIAHYNYPLITAIRLVELPFLRIFQRIDVLYLTVGFIGLFAGLSIVYLNIVEYICRILPKARRIYIVLAVGLAAFVVSQLIQVIKGIDETLINVITLSGILSAFLIPITLLIIAKVKKYANKEAA